MGVEVKPRKRNGLSQSSAGASFLWSFQQGFLSSSSDWHQPLSGGFGLCPAVSAERHGRENPLDKAVFQAQTLHHKQNLGRENVNEYLLGGLTRRPRQQIRK